MPGLEDLYREIILDHYRNPRNRGELPAPPATRAEGFNPLCGDEIVVYLSSDGQTVEDIKIGGEDPIDLYLAFVTSHDGSLRFGVHATPVRVVCRNTLNSGMKAAVQSWSVRHTPGATTAISEARRSAWTSQARAGLDSQRSMSGGCHRQARELPPVRRTAEGRRRGAVAAPGLGDS